MKKALLLLTVLAMSACVRAKVEKMTDTSYPPVSPDDVQVFQSAEDVDVPYTKIAVIHEQEPFTFTDDHDAVVAKAKKKAAAMGADAIILGAMHAPPAPDIELQTEQDVTSVGPLHYTDGATALMDAHNPRPDPAEQSKWSDITAIRLDK